MLNKILILEITNDAVSLHKTHIIGASLYACHKKVKHFCNDFLIIFSVFFGGKSLLLTIAHYRICYQIIVAYLSTK